MFRSKSTLVLGVLTAFNFGCVVPKDDHAKDAAKDAASKPAATNVEHDVANGPEDYKGGLGFLSTEGKYCTGFIIKDRCMLTAAHCAVQGMKTRFYMTEEPLSAGPKTYNIVLRSKDIGGYNPANDGENGSSNDITMAFMGPTDCSATGPGVGDPSEPGCLEGDAASYSTFGTVATGAFPAAGSLMDIMGYGVTSTSANGRALGIGISHRGKMAVKTTAWQANQGAGSYNTLIAEITNLNNACSGDSGGPIYKNGSIFGIISRIGGGDACVVNDNNLAGAYLYGAGFENGTGDWITQNKKEFCRKRVAQTTTRIMPSPSNGNVVGTLSDPIGPPPVNPLLMCGTFTSGTTGTCMTTSWAGTLTLTATPVSNGMMTSTFDKWTDSMSSTLCPCVGQGATCTFASESANPRQELYGYTCDANFKTTYTGATTGSATTGSVTTGTATSGSTTTAGGTTTRGTTTTGAATSTVSSSTTGGMTTGAPVTTSSGTTGGMTTGAATTANTTSSSTTTGMTTGAATTGNTTSSTTTTGAAATTSSSATTGSPTSTTVRAAVTTGPTTTTGATTR